MTTPVHQAHPFTIALPAFKPRAPHLGTIYTANFGAVMARFQQLRGRTTHLVASINVNSRFIPENRRGDAGTYWRETVQAHEEAFKPWQIKINQWTGGNHEEVTHCANELLSRANAHGDLEWRNCDDLHGPTQKLYFKLEPYRPRLREFFAQGKTLVQPQEMLERLNKHLRDCPLEDVAVGYRGGVWGTPLTLDQAPRAYDTTLCDRPPHATEYFTDLAQTLGGLGFGRREEAFRAAWPVDVQVFRAGGYFHDLIFWTALLWSVGLEPPRAFFGVGNLKLNGKLLTVDKEPGLETIEEVLRAPYIDDIKLWAESSPDGSRSMQARQYLIGTDFLSLHLGTGAEPQDHAVLDEKKFQLWRKVPAPKLVTTLANLHRLKMQCNEAIDLAGKIIVPPLFERKFTTYTSAMECFDFEKAGTALFDLIDLINRYEDACSVMFGTMVGKTQEMPTFYRLFAEQVRILAVALSPFCPILSQQINQAIGEFPGALSNRTPLEIFGHTGSGALPAKDLPPQPQSDPERVAHAFMLNPSRAWRELPQRFGIHDAEIEKYFPHYAMKSVRKIHQSLATQNVIQLGPWLAVSVLAVENALDDLGSGVNKILAFPHVQRFYEERLRKSEGDLRLIVSDELRGDTPEAWEREGHYLVEINQKSDGGRAGIMTLLERLVVKSAPLCIAAREFEKKRFTNPIERNAVVRFAEDGGIPQLYELRLHQDFRARALLLDRSLPPEGVTKSGVMCERLKLPGQVFYESLRAVAPEVLTFGFSPSPTLEVDDFIQGIQRMLYSSVVPRVFLFPIISGEKASTLLSKALRDHLLTNQISVATFPNYLMLGFDDPDSMKITVTPRLTYTGEMV